jgi:hypothetical protein
MTVTGGFPIGLDGRVHGTFTHNPSSLRLSMVEPNLQNIPRAKGGVGDWVKECFVAGRGKEFWARDFSAIEAVLVGYFAGSERYVRFAKLGVHAYLASHIVGRPADLAWSTADLRDYFKVLKKEESPSYNLAKRIVHGGNYMMTPRKMHFEWTEEFPTIKAASVLQDLYFDLFPEIKTWHKELCLRVDGTKRRPSDDEPVGEPWNMGVCFVQNPFGYVHRFYNVLDWDKVGKEWVWSFGEDAKRLASFLPQSTAAGIIKAAGKRLWYEYPWVGETMRLWIHDEIFGEADEADVQACLDVSGTVMEAPIEQLPLDPTWGMGPFLTIGTEAKTGRCWGDM